jgi:hypothetical protein
MLQTTLRHHTISASQRYSLKILTEHVAFLPLLFTCREIYAEATPLWSQLAVIASAVRLIVHWQSFGGTAMRAILRCASSPAEECVGSSDLDVLLPEPDLREEGWQHKVANVISSNFGLAELQETSQYLHATVRRIRHNIQCPFTSHAGLHALFQYSTRPIALPHIEVAVECTESVKYEVGELKLFLYEFIRWSISLQSDDKIGQLKVQLRLIPIEDESKSSVENCVLPYLKDLQKSTEGGKWQVEAGEMVLKQEREERWDESMRSR